MPEHLRALIVILFLATVVFTMARRPALDLIRSADFKRRRNLWFALTLLVFVSGNFWVYAVIAVPVLLVAGRREHNPMALFLMLLFLMPAAAIPVPGFGVINYRSTRPYPPAQPERTVARGPGPAPRVGHLAVRAHMA